jgi:WD40 repeat protein
VVGLRAWLLMLESFLAGVEARFWRGNVTQMVVFSACEYSSEVAMDPKVSSTSCTSVHHLLEETLCARKVQIVGIKRLLAGLAFAREAFLRGSLERELPRPFLAVWHSLPKHVSSALRCTLSGHSGPVRGSVVSRDGRVMVSASEDRTLKVWDATTGAERYTLFGHTGAVNGCAVSPDGSFLVSTSWACPTLSFCLWPDLGSLSPETAPSLSRGLPSSYSAAREHASVWVVLQKILSPLK